MLPQKSLAHEAIFLQDSGGCLIEFKNMGCNADELPLLKSEIAKGSNDIGHYALAPVGLGEPVTDFCTMLIDHVIKPAAADELVIFASDGKVNGMAQLGGCFGRMPDKPVGILFGVGVGNPKRVGVDVLIVEKFHEGGLVAWMKSGQMDVVGDGDFEFVGFVVHVGPGWTENFCGMTHQ